MVEVGFRNLLFRGAAMQLSTSGAFRRLLAFTVLVWIDTIYGRYHYAADGLAGISVSALAISVSLIAGKVYRPCRRSTVPH